MWLFRYHIYSLFNFISKKVASFPGPHFIEDPVNGHPRTHTAQQIFMNYYFREIFSIFSLKYRIYDGFKFIQLFNVRTDGVMGY